MIEYIIGGVLFVVFIVVVILIVRYFYLIDYTELPPDCPFLLTKNTNLTGGHAIMAVAEIFPEKFGRRLARCYSVDNGFDKKGIRKPSEEVYIPFREEQMQWFSKGSLSLHRNIGEVLVSTKKLPSGFTNHPIGRMYVDADAANKRYNNTLDVLEKLYNESRTVFSKYNRSPVVESLLKEAVATIRLGREVSQGPIRVERTIDVPSVREETK